MSEYTPKVGDRVRATLGESVLVGDVTWLYEDGDVQLDIASPDGSRYVCDMDWKFEQVVELPSKPWALVGHPTDYDYVPYIRDRSGNWHEIDSDGQTLRVDEETVMHYMTRGFTVLFEGVTSD